MIRDITITVSRTEAERIVRSFWRRLKLGDPTVRVEFPNSVNRVDSVAVTFTHEQLKLARRAVKAYLAASDATTFALALSAVEVANLSGDPLVDERPSAPPAPPRLIPHPSGLPRIEARDLDGFLRAMFNRGRWS